MNDAAAPGELEDTREFLLRSLEDLESEYRAGDLSDEDYRDLRDSYTARTAAVLRALEAEAHPPDGSSAPQDRAVPPAADVPTDGEPHDTPGASRRRTRRTVIVGGAVVVFAVVAIVLVVSGSGTRLPGETVSGSITLSAQRQMQRTLLQAQTLEQQGNAPEALQLYHQVLTTDPGNVTALSETGWLEFEAGVETHNTALATDGQADEQRAEGDAAGQPVPHLYFGSMLLVDGDAAGAVAQYDRFLADSPTAAEVRQATPFIDKAYAAIDRTPPSLPAS